MHSFDGHERTRNPGYSTRSLSEWADALRDPWREIECSRCKTARNVDLCALLDTMLE
jgi:hypothetical protein